MFPFQSQQEPAESAALELPNIYIYHQLKFADEAILAVSAIS